MDILRYRIPIIKLKFECFLVNLHDISQLINKHLKRGFKILMHSCYMLLKHIREWILSSDNVQCSTDVENKEKLPYHKVSRLR